MAILFTSAAILSTTKKRPSPKLLCSGDASKRSSTISRFFTGFRKNKNTNSKYYCNRISGFSVSCSSKGEKSTTWTQSHLRKNPKRGVRFPILSEGRDEDESIGLICPGCGVFMQDRDPNVLGFYQKKKKITEKETMEGAEPFGELLVDEFEDFSEGEDEEEDSVDGPESKFEESDEEEDDLEKEDEIDWDSDEWESEDEDDKWKKALDGFVPAGVGYGNITEETLKKKERISKAEKKKKAREAQRKKEEEEEEVSVCARCHSLRNYGHVKNQKAENLIPDFDFNRLISTRLIKASSSSGTTVIVMVVDCVDFDGSFPKRAANSLFKALEKNNDQKLSKSLKLVLVATKVDLLPSQISPTRLDRWVRNRAKAGGAPKLSGVYLVSARKDLGVRNLLSFVKELAGPRGNVWVIGAQNAGKSTLINAFAKREGMKITKLTEAPVPGTTLGILRIRGVLPAKAKMYDTPGLLHPYLMSMRLNRDEQKMIEIRKELQPRTYRMKAGQAVHVGGLMRLDLSQASVQTIYVTIFASPNVSLHMGKIENADEIWRKHAGIRLQPPIDVDRIAELGTWEQREIKVSGNSWDVNSIDISAAGLGWFSLGLKGEATLTLWTYDGVEIILREPLVLDRAPHLEKSGFLLPKAISEALGNQTKLEAQMRKKLEDEKTDSLSEVIV